MELRTLRYFIAVADDLHFGRAARRLSMTQPPLSSAIRQLEEELGLRLFDRHSRRVQLTPEGTAFLRKARDLLQQAERTQEYASALSSGSTGHLTIGFTGTMFYRGLADVLSGFSADDPGFEVSLCEASTIEQIELLHAGRLDAGFLNMPMDPEGLRSVVLCREHFVACLPATHPLASRKRIELSSLSRESFVSFARSVSPWYFDHVLSLCNQAGFSPRLRIDGKQLFSVVVLVAHGLGVSLVPASLARSGIRDVRFIPLTRSEARPTAFLAWHPDREPPGLARFVQTVERVAASMAQPRSRVAAWPGSLTDRVVSSPNPALADGGAGMQRPARDR